MVLITVLAGCGSTATSFVVHNSADGAALPVGSRLFVQFDGETVTVEDFCDLPGTTFALRAEDWVPGRCATPAVIDWFVEPSADCGADGPPADAEPTGEPVLTYEPTGEEPCARIDADGPQYQTEPVALPEGVGRGWAIVADAPDLR